MNEIKEGMRVVIEGMGYGHPAFYETVLESHVGKEFTVAGFGDNINISSSFAHLKDFPSYVHNSYLRDVTCIPKVGEKVKFRSEYAVKDTYFWGHKDTEWEIYQVIEWVDKEVSVNLKAKGTGYLFNCYMDTDGSYEIIGQPRRTVFEYLGQSAAVVNNGVYCSCGGPTKIVPAGITPASGFYTFCTACNKERK